MRVIVALMAGDFGKGALASGGGNNGGSNGGNGDCAGSITDATADPAATDAEFAVAVEAGICPTLAEAGGSAGAVGDARLALLELLKSVGPNSCQPNHPTAPSTTMPTATAGNIHGAETVLGGAVLFGIRTAGLMLFRSASESGGGAIACMPSVDLAARAEVLDAGGRRSRGTPVALAGAANVVGRAVAKKGAGAGDSSAASGIADEAGPVVSCSVSASSRRSGPV